MIFSTTSISKRGISFGGLSHKTFTMPYNPSAWRDERTWGSEVNIQSALNAYITFVPIDVRE